MRLSVQVGRKRLAVTYYGRVIGLLVPYDDHLRNVEEQIRDWKEMPLTIFRDELTEAWETVLGEAGGLWLTFHTRRIAAFVSPTAAEQLKLVPEIPQTALDSLFTQEAGSL